MKVLRQIMLFTIVLALLSGSMGITVLIHHCKSAKKTEYLSYPEFNLKHSKFCCAASIIKKSTKPESSTSLKKSACCDFSKLNLKVKPYQLTLGAKVPEQSSFTLPTLALFININISEHPLILELHPPPVGDPPTMSGKEIVYFTHQLRIPSAC